MSNVDNRAFRQNLQRAKQLKPTLAQTLRETVRRLLSDVHTSMPGIVQKYHSDDTADVQPSLSRRLFTRDAVLPWPTITNVPVIYLGPTNGWLHYPLAQGDTGLLLFSERSIERWRQLGVAVDPEDARMHDASDAVFLAGLRDQTRKIVLKGDPTSMELAFGAAWLEITAAGKFRLKNGATDLTTVLNDILNVTAFAQAPPGGGPLILTPPHDPATVGLEISSLLG